MEEEKERGERRGRFFDLLLLLFPQRNPFPSFLFRDPPPLLPPPSFHPLPPPPPHSTPHSTVHWLFGTKHTAKEKGGEGGREAKWTWKEGGRRSRYRKWKGEREGLRRTDGRRLFGSRPKDVRLRAGYSVLPPHFFFSPPM